MLFNRLREENPIIFENDSNNIHKNCKYMKDFGCDFYGSFVEVEEHEGECRYKKIEKMMSYFTDKINTLTEENEKNKERLRSSTVELYTTMGKIENSKEQLRKNRKRISELEYEYMSINNNDKENKKISHSSGALQLRSSINNNNKDVYKATFENFDYGSLLNHSENNIQFKCGVIDNKNYTRNKKGQYSTGFPSSVEIKLSPFSSSKKIKSIKLHIDNGWGNDKNYISYWFVNDNNKLSVKKSIINDRDSSVTLNVQDGVIAVFIGCYYNQLTSINSDPFSTNQYICLKEVEIEAI
eukprot:TRINITY_DN4041_c0_g1_i1.p1 TRINITY_DN4041_c0_g1~~TRINITY_DN4041_c0_g1_i1.p1  ORF type:complete len:297 (-),score=71.78 TRINITY_DN4041_c0_g1_i1:39-929(-)